LIGPWYISVRAVREYLAIVRRQESEESFARAEGELADMAQKLVERGAEPRRLDSGLLQYRGGRPPRLRLSVSEAARPVAACV